MESGQRPKNGLSDNLPVADSISDEQAIQLARQATIGKAEVPEDVMPTVERAEGHCIVTFPIKHPPGVFGADFYAQVTINARSGEIGNILGGH